MPAPQVHTPWKISVEEQSRYGVKIGMPGRQRGKLVDEEKKRRAEEDASAGEPETKTSTTRHYPAPCVAIRGWSGYDNIRGGKRMQRRKGRTEENAYNYARAKGFHAQSDFDCSH